jgi:hypothetical protein
MEIAAFAEMTYRILKDTPLSEYQPTLCLPEKRQILTLASVSRHDEERVRDIALDWARSTAGQLEEFIVAFRDGDGYFRVIRSSSGKLQEALFPEKQNA